MIEQPSSSLTSRHPRFQWLCSVAKAFGAANLVWVRAISRYVYIKLVIAPEVLQVFVTQCWMMHYNHPCPKRTVLWSSSPRIVLFNKGRLEKKFKDKQKALHGNVQPVKKTVNKQGKIGYSGTSALKSTQHRPELFILSCVFVAHAI